MNHDVALPAELSASSTIATTGKRPTEASSRPQRFLILDLIRGLAAIAVVFNHWKHFFFRGVDAANAYDRANSPAYGALWPLYEYGWLAVDLFFSLSGFVFFFLYAEKVAARNVGAREFFILRVSRLYPLHIVTLLVVAGLQALARYSTGSFLVYPDNDAYHFVLNLLFLSGWGLERGHSFNAPIWSVSVEVALYFLFFAGARHAFPSRWRAFALVVGAGLLVQTVGLVALGRGITSFFLGGAVCAAYRSIGGREASAQNKHIVYGVMLAMGLVISALIAFHGHIPLPAKLQRGAHLLLRLGVSVVLFPVLVLTAALAEPAKPKSWLRAAVLGDWSYSVYLWHFPLQLVCLLALGLNPEFYERKLALVSFLSVVLVIAALSFRFERSAQSYLRRRLLS